MLSVYDGWAWLGCPKQGGDHEMQPMVAHNAYTESYSPCKGCVLLFIQWSHRARLSVKASLGHSVD